MATRKKQSTVVRNLQRKLTEARNLEKAARNEAANVRKQLDAVFADGAVVRFTKQCLGVYRDADITRYEAVVLTRTGASGPLCIEVGIHRDVALMRPEYAAATAKRYHEDARRQLTDVLFRTFWPL